MSCPSAAPAASARWAAEDVVQEAFCGLFRRWAHLADKDKALSYVRSCALNGCRSELRRRIRNERRVTRDAVPADAESAEYAALVGEEHREVLTALRRLPGRQREALVLRFYLDLSEPEIAAAMDRRAWPRSAAGHTARSPPAD